MHKAANRRLHNESEMPGAWSLWAKRDHGGALAAWLNSDFSSEAGARADVSKAIRDMNNLEVEYEWVRQVHEDWQAHPSEETAHNFYEAQSHVRPRGLRRLFQKVKARMTLAPGASPFDKWEIEWTYSERDALSFHEAAQQWLFGMDAHKAVGCLIKLAEAGLVGRMRQCWNCQKWIYAKFERQRFCSGPCREKAFRGSAEGKRKRREYMQGYRSRLKRMDENYLKSSSKPRR